MNDLTMIENELVPVYKTSTGEKVVYGTELHKVLGVKSNYRDWVRNRLSDCEAIENEDFESFAKNLAKGRPSLEHIIKLDTAKEMAMLERNEKGKQVRRYFILVEKKYQKTMIDITQLSPELQMFNTLFRSIAQQQLEQKRQAAQVAKIEETVSNMKQVFAEPISDWKNDINAKIREISVKSGISYSAMYDQLYGELETTAHCSLKRLQDNKRNRMLIAGNTKTAINSATTKIAIIHEKPQLKAIFESIVKKYAMKYCT